MINSSRAKDSLTSGRPMLLRSLIRPKYVTVRASALAQSGPKEGGGRGERGQEGTPTSLAAWPTGVKLPTPRPAGLALCSPQPQSCAEVSQRMTNARMDRPCHAALWTPDVRVGFEVSLMGRGTPIESWRSQRRRFMAGRDRGGGGGRGRRRRRGAYAEC